MVWKRGREESIIALIIAIEENGSASFEVRDDWIHAAILPQVSQIGVDCARLPLALLNRLRYRSFHRSR